MSNLAMTKECPNEAMFQWGGKMYRGELLRVGLCPYPRSGVLSGHLGEEE